MDKALLLVSKTTGLTFGQAVAICKAGGMIARAGWNGKNMFVFMRPGDQINVGHLEKIKSLPECVKRWYKRAFLTDLDHAVTFSPYLCMKAADDTLVNGWLASQTDMLATDWVELYFYDDNTSIFNK